MHLQFSCVVMNFIISRPRERNQIEQISALFGSEVRETVTLLNVANAVFFPLSVTGFSAIGRPGAVAKPRPKRHACSARSRAISPPPPLAPPAGPLVVAQAVQVSPVTCYGLAVTAHAPTVSSAVCPIHRRPFLCLAYIGTRDVAAPEMRARVVQLQFDETFHSTRLDQRVGPRLRELMPRGQRESGGENHATQGPISSLYRVVIQIIRGVHPAKFLRACNARQSMIIGPLSSCQSSQGSLYRPEKHGHLGN